MNQVINNTFDVRAMQRLLDGKHGEMRQQVRQQLSQPRFAYQYFDDTQAYREHVYEWCKLLADEGFGSLTYPKAYGGQDDMPAYLAAMETLSYHDLSLLIKFGVQFGLFGNCIHNLGTAYHHEKYLPSVGDFSLPGCFAMTELGHGSNVRDIETVARYERESQMFILDTPSESARKEYIGNAANHGRMATVFAQLEIDDQRYGVNVFVVPIRDEQGNPMPGVSIGDCGEKMGLNGVDNGRLWFDQVRIPRAEMLDRFAQVTPEGEYVTSIENESRRFFTMLGTLVGGRIGIGASALSAAKSGLTIAIRYGAERRQFGPDNEPETIILDYQTHQRRLMPLLANVYAVDFAIKYLAQRYADRTEDDAREIEALAAGIKAFSSWNTTHTLQTCREACGGQGYLAVNRLAALKADTDIFTTFEGDNTVLMQLVAKGCLSEFKQQFHDMNLVGLVRHVAQQAATVVTQLNPIVTRITDADHLRDSQFHLDAFRYREQSLISSAARRLKSRIDQGMDGHDALIECQQHLVNLGHAFVERVILEQFLAGVEDCENDELKGVLERLATLFALAKIEQHKGWYLEHNYLEGGKTRAIRRQVDLLCAEVRVDAVALVNAFGIPDQCLAAPIAF